VLTRIRPSARTLAVQARFFSRHSDSWIPVWKMTGRTLPTNGVLGGLARMVAPPATALAPKAIEEKPSCQPGAIPHPAPPPWYGPCDTCPFMDVSNPCELNGCMQETYTQRAMRQTRQSTP